jgi:predicted ATPase
VSELVERDELIAAIADRRRRAATEGGSVIWLGGEAGSGKTALVGAVAERSRDRVLTGWCDAMTTPRALGPLLDMAAAGGRLRPRGRRLPHRLTIRHAATPPARTAR